MRGALLDAGEVREDYLGEWPMDYQTEALGFASQLRGALLHHPTGSGKTFTAILWGLLEPGPFVIVTRAATRVQYAREVERFTRLRAFVCKPASEVRKRDKWQSLDDYLDWCAAEGQRPVVTVGWEALPSWADALAGVLGGTGAVVYDESHKGKSKKRWEALPLPDRDSPDYAAAVDDVRKRGGKVKPAQDGDGEVGLVPLGNVAESATRLARAALRRLATTATPIPDRVRDLWGQLDLLEPFAWGSYRTYAYRYCDAREGVYGGLDDRGESNLTELDERLSMVMHTVPVAVARASLPPKRRQTWYIAPSEQVAPTGGWKRVIKAATARGASALLEVRLAMAASSKRRAVVQRIAEHMESGHKVVVFTARKRDADEIAEASEKIRGKGAPTGGVWCGHGSHSQGERRAMLDAYRASEGSCVLVGTGEAWGTGIDGLQCTDAAIFALLPYTPGQLDQWEGRFTRHGQDRPVTVYYPIAEGTADEHLASILLDKLPAVDALVGIESLEGAADALAGTETDSEAFAAGVLAALRDAEGDDDDE
jgi:SNF2 family DNA or RNA helicase